MLLSCIGLFLCSRDHFAALFGGSAILFLQSRIPLLYLFSLCCECNSYIYFILFYTLSVICGNSIWSILTDNSCTCTDKKKYQLFMKDTSRCQGFTSRALSSCASFYEHDEWNRSDAIHKTGRRLVVIRWNEVDLVLNDAKCDIFSSRILFYLKYLIKRIKDILYFVLTLSW